MLAKVILTRKRSGREPFVLAVVRSAAAGLSTRNFRSVVNRMDGIRVLFWGVPED